MAASKDAACIVIGAGCRRRGLETACYALAKRRERDHGSDADGNAGQCQ
nr:hypothetical protein [Roseiflexus sp.]